MDHNGPAEAGGRTIVHRLAADGGQFTGWWVPSQRCPEPSPAQAPARPPAPAPVDTHGVAATTVLPYVGSKISQRTRSVRAWMLAMPVDLAAMLASLMWTSQYWKGTVFAALLTVALFAVGGLYRGRRHISILDELPALCVRLLAAGAVVGIITAVRHDSVSQSADFLRGLSISAGLVLVGRTFSRSAVLLARRRRWVEHGAIVVGSGPVARQLARLLRRHPQYGLRFIGFVDTDATVVSGAPVLADLDGLDRAIETTGCDVVIIADPQCAETDLLAAVRSPGCAGCDLWMVPRLREMYTYGGGIADHIGAVPVVHVRRQALDGLPWVVKRLSDVLFAGVALVLLSPLMALCALAVRIEGGPGVFFRQQRVGRHGKVFELIKFRSMRPVDEHESRTNWSVAGDPRIGRVGRFLRRTSLDELPQLWNVLRGDMTVVGPRPERPHFVDQFSANDQHYAMRHRVPVGLTGLAQVSGLRGDTPISDRARFDNYYIENWSLWLDIKVLLRTFLEVVQGGGR